MGHRDVEQAELLVELVLVHLVVEGTDHGDAAVQRLDDEDRPPLQALGGVHGGQHQSILAVWPREPISGRSRGRIQGQLREHRLHAAVVRAMPLMPTARILG